MHIQYRLFGICESTFLRLYVPGLRIIEIGAEHLAAAKSGPRAIIYAIWHSRIMIPLYYQRNQQLQVLVTHERHGQYVADTLNRLGFGVVRGRTSWMDGIRKMVGKLRAGFDAAVAPDGPHGPPEVVQPGIIYLSQRTGAPIVPYVVSFSHCVRLPTWDGYRVPLPFTRVLIRWGEPLFVPRSGASPVREEHRRILQRRMDELYALADEQVRMPLSSNSTATSSQSGKNGQRTHSAQSL